MIALNAPARYRPHNVSWHADFMALVPTIRKYAQRAFWRLDVEAREELIAETVANAFVAYVRLRERGKQDLAYPTVLARFAVAQIKDSRKVGSRRSSKDMLSRRAQTRHGFHVERLDRFDKESGQWIEAVIEDTATPVPDQAAFRCDFPTWLAIHSGRNRQIAETLALGHSTKEVAKQFRISPARISQLRKELHDSWLRFHGENPCQDGPAPAVTTQPQEAIGGMA